MIKLLYNQPKKRLKKEFVPEKLAKANYEDTEYIREKIGELPNDETLRIRFIRNQPLPAYRVTILKRYKKSHTVKTKDGLSVLLHPGLYVSRQYWMEKTADGFLSVPALPDGD